MLQGLVNYYERLEATGEVAPPGFSSEKISFALMLNADGSVRDVMDLRDTKGKKHAPKILRVPQAIKKSVNIESNFLWEKTAYMFGAGGASKRLTEEHKAFIALHEKLLGTSDDEGLKALLLFLRGWTSDRYQTLRYHEDMLDQNVVFRFGGEHGYVHERSAAKKIWADHASSSGAARGLCLITGEQAPIARLHPSIKGVPGAQSSGASLVSFNLDAFKSYGKEQGANAPVSERAAHAYGIALNDMLSRGADVDEKTKRRTYTNRVQIGDATTLFWAEALGGPAEGAAAIEAEKIVSMMFDPPPTDEQELSEIRPILQQIEAGRGIEEIDGLKHTLHPETRFFVLGLSPNAARLSVRFSHQTTLGTLIENARRHWQDMNIQPHRWTSPPALWRLLRETAAQGKTENVSPLLAGELARAIFTGNRYPRALLNQTLLRIRADGDINERRIALIKACIARDFRLGFEQEDVPVALDINEKNPAYRLGRLFCLLEKIQRAALGRVNASIRDKFFSSASANPARVFPLLLRGTQDHISKIRKKGSGGLSHWFDQQIAEIMQGLPAHEPFPATFRMEDQGRFAVGYYHQDYKVKEDGKETEIDTIETSDQD
jgi:CRISPR-associated protein Csd1